MIKAMFFILGIILDYVRYLSRLIANVSRNTPPLTANPDKQYDTHFLHCAESLKRSFIRILDFFASIKARCATLARGFAWHSGVYSSLVLLSYKYYCAKGTAFHS